MKTTLHISDPLYRRVKAKSSLAGLPVCEVTSALYALWLDGGVVLPPRRDEAFPSFEEWEEKWFGEADGIGADIERTAKGKKTARELLEADRR